MKRILVFCFFPAFVPPSNGGESRLFNFYKSLSRFHHITLLTSTHLNTEEERVDHGGNFIERRIPKDSHFVTKWDELMPYSSGGDLSAVCITAAGKLPTLLHNAYLEEYANADIIIHDSPFTIDYDLFFEVDSKVRIYNSYNCETSLYKTLHPEVKSKLLWDIVKEAEVKMLDGCDVVLYCNVTDLDEFKQLAPDSKYTKIFAPNGMSPLSNVVRNIDKNKVNSVVFIGSGHPPNVDAALQIVNNIAPALPHLTFHIIGGCLPKGKYPKNVVRHGFVNDNVKAELICKADLAINPMGEGSGSNVKVFDLFSYAIPILSTEFGMRGVDATNEKNCLIAPLSEFSELIELWSTRYDELKTIGLNGKEFAAEYYSWDVIAKNVLKKLPEFKKNKRWSEKFILVLNDYDSFNNAGGGGVRTREIYKAVSDWCPTLFICFSDDEELTVRYENDNIIIFSIPKTQEHTEKQRIMNSYFQISVDDIVAHRQCRSNDLFVAIYNILKILSRNIIVEHPYLSSIPLLFNDRFIYSSQNNEVQIKSDLLKYHPLYEELIRDVEEIERKAVECSAAVIAVSKNDAVSFSQMARTIGPINIIHNGASVPASPSKQELTIANKSICKEKSAVFIGSAHMPNVDAVKYIIDKLAPACPSVEFHIVGSVCDISHTSISDNIHFWGVLSETMKSAVMETCTIAINTVISGGGSNIKLADYFANGLYVVTTPFGLRGYPKEVCEHLVVAELTNFESAIKNTLLKIKNEEDNASSKRQELFYNYLSMKSKSQEVVDLLKNLEKSKKKVLFVTYRYTSPSLGGAESMLENLIEYMDDTDEFQIDVVAPEVSKIKNQYRFSDDYEFDDNIGAKVGLRNVRFARFPLNDEVNVTQQITDAWQVQPLFEREVYLRFKDSFELSGLAWGWAEPENNSQSSRWAFVSCGLHLFKETKVCIKCYTPKPIVIWLKNQNGDLISLEEVNGYFDLDFIASKGTIEITVSTDALSESDVRPLGFLMSELFFDEQQFDLAKPLLLNSDLIDDEKRFQILDEACNTIRTPLNINLSNIRGPFSSNLEEYLEENIKKYDLVVTHNNVFRPAVIAVEKANKQNVPIIMIPHAHLDDDFYHFPDINKSIVNSNLVLASPKITCKFYKKKGAKVSYLPAGININEVFSDDDIAAFKNIYSLEKPFVLVLGRKSNAKGYQQVINSIEQLSKNMEIHLVMIGPDDDCLPVNSSHVSYLGMQTREVVRGALLSCNALINMSSSESFGIVLLEAWMAGKPVIVNDTCAAFHDLAIDNFNALMVDNDKLLQEAIRKVINDPVLCERLAKNGKEILKGYDWKHIGSLFVTSCKEVILASHSV